MKLYFIQTLCFTVLCTFSVFCKASDFGTTGLITLPSARMQADGSLTATLARNEIVDIYNITFQAAPFLETTFRYSIFNPRDRAGSKDALRDRSYEVKLKLLDEGKYRPAVGVGVRDVLGTGVWSGEYFVVSKALGNLDVTLGAGWGRLAGRASFSNPLQLVSDRFEERPSGANIGGIVGGEVRAKSFFRGDVGLFGGVRYSLKNSPITFIAEYTSDDYQREVRFQSISDPSPLSLGLEWKIAKGLTITGSYQQEQYFGLTLRSVNDFKRIPKRVYERFYSAADAAGKNVAPAHLDLDSWYDTLLFDAERSGLRVHAAYVRPGDDQVRFAVSNDRYALWADALNQFFTLTEIHLPREYRSVSVQTLDDNLLGNTLRYQRKTPQAKTVRPSERTSQTEKEPVSLIDILPGAHLKRPTYQTDFDYPKLALGADLALRVQLMDPNEPLKHQLYVKGTGRLALSDSLNLWSAITVDVSNDFNTKRPSDSVLPRVRSEINRYLTEGETGVDTLFLSWQKSMWPNVHARLSGGLLEEMFGGVSLEVLWEPFASRLALGANFNWVQQRDYDKRFGFRDYKVTTGHASIFYASSWYNVDLGLHIGRYLAKDKGYTFEARRTFDNGFSIGAFVTRTNVSAVDFGEGSFDKGLFVSVPYSLLFSVNTRGKYSTIIRSIERDGGRRLESVGNLWWDRRALRYDAFDQNKQRIAP